MERLGGLDSLFAPYVHEVATFDVTLPGGETVGFRAILGRRALVSLRNAAQRYASSVTVLNCPEELRPFMTADEETLIWVYFLGHLAVDGDAADFLRLQHRNPILFDFILDEVQCKLMGATSDYERARIDAAKKGSASTRGGGDASKRRGTSGVGTRGSLRATPTTTI